MDPRHRYGFWLLWLPELGSQWTTCLPNLIEGQPGELHVAYSWAGRQAIRYVTLRELEVIGYDP